MRPEVRRRNKRNKQRQASKNYWKNNKSGDAGGQESRPNVNDDEMIFTSYRRPERVTAYGGGRMKYNKGGSTQPEYKSGEMHQCKPL